MRIKKLSEKLAGVCRAAFPHYRGRKWRLEAREKVSTLSYWSGGSKDYYAIVDLASNCRTPLAETNVFGKLPEATQIQPSRPLVEHSIFCWKDTGLTVYCHPDDLQMLLSGCILAEIKT